jgi:hypothetical protein
LSNYRGAPLHCPDESQARFLAKGLPQLTSSKTRITRYN